VRWHGAWDGAEENESAFLSNPAERLVVLNQVGIAGAIPLENAEFFLFCDAQETILEPMEPDRAEIDLRNMEKAIAAAHQCCPIDHRIPKVGAVIALGEEIIATGTRGSGKVGDDDHAEMVAINNAQDQSQFAKRTSIPRWNPVQPRSDQSR